MRVLGLWLPDWPVQAARAAGALGGADALAPVAVVADATVAACSAAARRAGVRRGQGRRHAQAMCPDLVVVEEDPARDAREFEPVLARLGDVAAGIEPLRPGLVVLGADGPARYHGGEARAIELLGIPVEGSKIITCHLGNGSSIAAVKDGAGGGGCAGVPGGAGEIVVRPGVADPR